MSGIAIFDLDKTITRQGTWSRFVRHATGARFWPGLPVVAAQAIAYKAGLASRGSVKERAISVYLAGQAKSELEALAEAFIAKEVAQGLRKQTQSVIAEHKSAGDTLIIASAAVDLICAPMSRALGFEDIICTKLSWDRNDRLQPELDGENCYGEEKLRRVEAFFGPNGPTGPVTFYSDHHTDLPCLTWAKRGVAVNPSKKLRNLAPPNGVEIVDWDR
ncbi:MAG: HAD-IB family hydrolase [Pseudomonadota bacterium]